MNLPRIDKTYDRWTPERVCRHLAYWLGWMLLYATVNSSNTPIGFFRWLTIELLIMTVKLPFTYCMIYLLIPKFFLRKKYKTFVLLTLLFTVAGGTMIWLFHYIYLLEKMGHTIPDSFFDGLYFYKTLDLIYVATFPAIFKMYQFYLREEMNKRNMAEEKLTSELELLKNQLQPHFLFNTLNNLYGLILTRHEQAGQVVLQLSQMMRYMLYECNAGDIALSKEVELIRNYIALEKVRYGNRISVHFEVDGPIEEARIAPLLLIGFIENAFKHGIHNNIDSPWVRVNLWLQEGELDFMAENAVPQRSLEAPPVATTGGIGLENIRRRLDLLYDGRYALEIKQSDSFLVRLKIFFESTEGKKLRRC